MSADFEVAFNSSTKSLDDILRSSSEILAESGLQFQHRIWRLFSVGGMPGIKTHVPVEVDNIEEVPRSLELFSKEVGEVYFKVFGADGRAYHILYSESRRIHRMREHDDSLHKSLLSMMLQMGQAFDTDISIYRCESPDGYRPPSIDDVKSAIALGKTWDGEIVIVSGKCVDESIKNQMMTLGHNVMVTTTDRYVIDYLGSR
jgi:hypothetical protein